MGATILEINREIGEKIGVQLSVDALKLSPTNPGLWKLNAADHGKIKRGIWKLFAKFGIGSKAQPNGAHLPGIIPDFNPPSHNPLID
jgi:hypothetical protein